MVVFSAPGQITFYFNIEYQRDLTFALYATDLYLMGWCGANGIFDEMKVRYEKEV